MIKTSVEIINKLGLHARASSKFTVTASRFASEVWVVRDKKRVNGKSIMGVMMLAASKGSTIELEVSGVDEKQASAALIALINSRFDEAE